MAEIKQYFGAQEFGVDEPISKAILPVYFEVVAEPRELSIAVLTRITALCGSYAAAARYIGASEAFVRQTVQGKIYSRQTKKALKKGLDGKI